MILLSFWSIDWSPSPGSWPKSTMWKIVLCIFYIFLSNSTSTVLSQERRSQVLIAIFPHHLSSCKRGTQRLEEQLVLEARIYLVPLNNVYNGHVATRSACSLPKRAISCREQFFPQCFTAQRTLPPIQEKGWIIGMQQLIGDIKDIWDFENLSLKSSMMRDL